MDAAPGPELVESRIWHGRKRDYMGIYGNIWDYMELYGLRCFDVV